jgi:hypothetical protein
MPTLFFLFVRVRWFRSLTCDFWAEFEEIFFEVRLQEKRISPLRCSQEREQLRSK